MKFTTVNVFIDGKSDGDPRFDLEHNFKAYSELKIDFLKINPHFVLQIWKEQKIDHDIIKVKNPKEER